MIPYACSLILLLGLAACSNDPPPTADGGQLLPDTLRADSASDASQPDSAPPAPDQGPPPPPKLSPGPVGVFFDPAEAKKARGASKDFFAGYITEVLAHAGIPHEVLSRADLLKPLTTPVILVPYATTFSGVEHKALEAHVKLGGTVVAIGGASGLDQLLGAKDAGTPAEGYLKAKSAAGVFHQLPAPIHVFGARPLSTVTAEEVAGLLDKAGKPTNMAGVTRRALGKGEAWAVAADLPGTLVAIQQGRPIYKDGPSAPDGTAPIKDGILKTDDGIVLDYAMDRTKVKGKPFFGRPVTDELKAVLLRIIFRGYRRQGLALPVLWYWPGALDAVGVLSHDSDNNDPARANLLLANLKKLKIESTWCFIQYPDKYPKSILSEAAKAGGEIALHYDARTPGNPKTKWGESYFKAQLAWLKQKSGKATILTNKNHYLRWEGWVELYRWCETAGVQADQSKGPSKSGNVGFLYGTAHPYFPVDDAAHNNRVIDVLAVNTLTQDLALTCDYEVGQALVDAALAHYGFVHYIFHPAHQTKSAVVTAMNKIVAYGRTKGLKWWSVARINTWERLRRKVSITIKGKGSFTVHAPQQVKAATLYLPLADGAKAPVVNAGGKALTTTQQKIYGVPIVRFTLDLPPGSTVFTLSNK